MMKIEFTEKEAAAICHGLKTCGYIFTHKSWVMEICKRFEEAAKAAKKTAMAACVVMLAVNANAAATTWQSAIQQAVQQVAQRISAATSKTNRVHALASPENYALLKSNKLTDATKKLALQKQLVEAYLADADEIESERMKWHGKYSRQSVDLNALKATFYHADGYAITVPFTKPIIVEEVKKANAKLPKLATTNGVPVKLAEARARRNEEKTNPIRNLTIETNANQATRPQL